VNGIDATLVFKYASSLLLGAAVFGVVSWLAAVPVPPAPRLGHRGAQRYQAIATNSLFAAIEPSLRFCAGLLGMFPLTRLRVQQELELRRAGYCLGLTSDEFIALSCLTAIALGSLVGALAKFAGSDTPLFVPAAIFGLVLPKLQVQEVIRERVKAISRGLPHCIEIAALCMGAGLDFPGALRMLVKNDADGRDALTQEFASILEELDLGHTRREALLNFADRVRTPAVRDFVNAVVQAEQKGNPLAKVIQVQGRMLNMRRSVAAEEAAARAGVLMIGPMVLQLGCILLLLMGPFLVKGIGF
jgi:tight adherence protein C